MYIRVFTRTTAAGSGVAGFVLTNPAIKTGLASLACHKGSIFGAIGVPVAEHLVDPVEVFLVLGWEASCAADFCSLGVGSFGAQRFISLPLQNDARSSGRLSSELQGGRTYRFLLMVRTRSSRQDTRYHQFCRFDRSHKRHLDAQSVP